MAQAASTIAGTLRANRRRAAPSPDLAPLPRIQVDRGLALADARRRPHGNPKKQVVAVRDPGVNAPGVVRLRLSRAETITSLYSLPRMREPPRSLPELDALDRPGSKEEMAEE